MNCSANSVGKYLKSISFAVSVDRSFLVIVLYTFLTCFTAAFMSNGGSRRSTIAGPPTALCGMLNFLRSFTRVLFSGTPIPAPHFTFIP
ncbi:hypothetical protein ATCV1_z777R [Acanthocystis turfacea chlorella virus 1]|uniref:Uncharacterized protein z777R n=1 Tax=Chlorovirus heliozoae TaxID=322019 RepID=A7KA37_9PHYC|nr:hypothetical protein ATCV1_z777R [Acanthocystis turfacea chlorella virus 1]ABT16911.1 hypothetical protein ATCV1_z777R [Acanthocystis turfacea chlorella virus 1]